MSATEVNDADKNGFMTAVHGLDRSKGLDLLLHTPGGGTAATVYTRRFIARDGISKENRFIG